MTDSFNIDEIAAHLDTKFVGRAVYYHATLPSTMTLARDLARGGAAEGTLVLAEVQTGGIGRLDRAWHTPGDNIALSLVLRPPKEKLPYIVMLAALAVTDAIQAACGLAAGIKWPNDVLLDTKKVCGILIQNELGGTPFTVVGIGLNVNLEVSAFPDIKEIATSLATATGGPVDRAGLLASLLEEIERRYVGLDAPETIFDDWRRRLVTLGRTVTVSGIGTEFSGVAEDVAADGGLLVRTASGHLEHVLAGDVSLK
jgi:BirA family transcriptional regulator, biotin operon repressor / biotin---[acetyl-CoA-carboxylase] ligase